MPNIVFQIITWNSDYVLEPCIKSLLPFGKVIITEGPVGYFAKQGMGTSTDRTNQILADLVGEENVIHGSFPEKDDMMNASIHLIPKDTTHVWMVDSDEIWNPDAIQRTIGLLDDYDSASFKPLTFFGGFDKVLGGFETRFTWYRIQRWYEGARWATHRPPTVLGWDGKPWRDHRHLESVERFFHYSYVFSKAVKSKSGYYGSWGGNIPDYFQTVWLRWVLGNDLSRQIIEDEYDGVHEWLKERRGPCRTTPFIGQHPKAIQDILPQLKERFNQELAEILLQQGAK